jgi:hypothetical protein
VCISILPHCFFSPLKGGAESAQAKDAFGADAKGLEDAFVWSAARLLPLFCAYFHPKARFLTSGRFKTAAASVPHST